MVPEWYHRAAETNAGETLQFLDTLAVDGLGDARDDLVDDPLQEDPAFSVGIGCMGGQQRSGRASVDTTSQRASCHQRAPVAPNATSELHSGRRVTKAVEAFANSGRGGHHYSEPLPWRA